MYCLEIEIAGIDLAIKSRRGIYVDEAIRPFVKQSAKLQKKESTDTESNDDEKKNVELFEIAELEENKDYISGLLKNAQIVFEDKFIKRYSVNLGNGKENYEVIEHCMNRNENSCFLYMVKIIGDSSLNKEPRLFKGPVMLYADKGFYEMFETEGKIYKFLDVENLLLKYNAFYLHAAFVKAEGKGIVFSADSGVGKSTQADLWEKYRDAKIINGDKTIIKYEDGNFVGWGSPYAGSSGIYEKDSAVVETICFLKQSRLNSVRKMNKLEAVSQLFVKSMVRSFDKDGVNRVTSLIERLAESVEIYEFSCTKDEEAVRFLESTRMQNRC